MSAGEHVEYVKATASCWPRSSASPASTRPGRWSGKLIRVQGEVHRLQLDLGRLLNVPMSPHARAYVDTAIRDLNNVIQDLTRAQGRPS